MSLSQRVRELQARCKGLSAVAWQVTLAESKRLRKLPPLMLEMAELIHGMAFHKGFHDGALFGYEEAERSRKV